MKDLKKNIDLKFMLFRYLFLFERNVDSELEAESTLPLVHSPNVHGCWDSVRSEPGARSQELRIKFRSLKWLVVLEFYQPLLLFLVCSLALSWNGEQSWESNPCTVIWYVSQGKLSLPGQTPFPPTWFLVRKRLRL